MIYLDNCATTQAFDEVIDAMTRAMKEEFANPSSLHLFSHEVHRRQEEMREEILSFLGAEGQILTFTSGATESNNLAIFSHLKGPGEKEVFVSGIDHPSVNRPIQAREDVLIREIPLDQSGHYDFETLLSHLSQKTQLLILTYVNSELGLMHDLEEWVPRIKAQYPHIHIHVDGVQAMGKVPLYLNRLKCDSFSFSAHKFHGPKGIGGLVTRRECRLEPLLFGGGQEGGVRSGTENMPGIYGMHAAIKKIEGYDEAHYREVEARKVFMITELTDRLEDIRINTTIPASPFILSISIQDIKGEVLLHMLEEEEIYISTSSACSSHRTGPNPVLAAIHMPKEYQEGTVRICMSHLTSQEEVEVFINILIEKVEEIRSITRRKS